MATVKPMIQHLARAKPNSSSNNNTGRAAAAPAQQQELSVAQVRKPSAGIGPGLLNDMID